MSGRLRSNDIDEDDKFVKGATDNTRIGNVGDSLKTSVTFSKTTDATDITGQLAVSQRTVTQSFIFSETVHPLFISKLEVSGGTATHAPARAAYLLTATTAAASRAVIETKRSVQYVVGQGHTVGASLTFGPAKANVTKQWGVYGPNNGFFFRQTSAGLSIVYRSNISGSIANTEIAQTNWNLDKVDGTGPSGFNLDVTKGAIYMMEYTWHGAGRVRMGIKANKGIIYVHEFDFDNSQLYVYSRNPYQPIRTEIFNTAAAASATEFHVHSISSYIHNHIPVFPNLVFTASRAISTVSVGSGSYAPLIAIRPALLFNGVTNRVTAEPFAIQIYTDGKPLHVEVIANPTTMTGANWVALNTASSVQYDISASAFTGGEIISEYYVSAATDLTVGAIPGQNTSQIGAYPLSLSIDATSQDVLLVVARALSGNSGTVAAISWREYQ